MGVWGIRSFRPCSGPRLWPSVCFVPRSSRYSPFRSTLRGYAPDCSGPTGPCVLVSRFACVSPAASPQPFGPSRPVFRPRRLSLWHSWWRWPRRWQRPVAVRTTAASRFPDASRSRSFSPVGCSRRPSRASLSSSKRTGANGIARPIAPTPAVELGPSPAWSRERPFARAATRTHRCPSRPDTRSQAPRPSTRRGMRSTGGR